MSERRACSVLLVNRSTRQYRLRRPGQAALEARIREICETRVRYGYRRVHGQLRREGWEINHKKAHRVYTELGMQPRYSEPVNATGSSEQANAEASREGEV